MVSSLKGALYNYRGAQTKNGTTTFRLYAPNAKSVTLCLTAKDKVEQQMQMLKNQEGIWEVSTSRANPGRTYLYSVEDCHGKTMLRTDPMSFSTQYVSKKKRLESVVVDRSNYQWHDSAWMAQRAKKRPLAIYEVQLKSWKTSCDAPMSFRELAGELVTYCKKMNFTHVELYGLLDHIRALEHGYQISHFFSPYHAQGSSNDLKYLIDELHKAGIGVILDWVMAHFHHASHSSSYSASLHEYDGTNLYAGENSNWGTRYFDYSKEETRRLMQASALYWLDEMHVDGLRLDAVSQMIERDGKEIEPAIAFLQELNTLVHEQFPGVLMIAEDTDNHPNLTKKVSVGGLGFDLKWGIGWNREARNYFHRPSNARDTEPHYKMVRYLKHVQTAEKQILSHSHDDSDSNSEQHDLSLYRHLATGTDEMAHFSNLKNFFCWQILAPSSGYLIHMGDELGQTESWYRRFQKRVSSVDWKLEQNEKHQKLQKCVSDLNALYQAQKGLWKEPEQGFQLISEFGPTNIIAYHRENGKSRRLAIIHNFSDVAYPSYDIPLPDDDDKLLQIKKITEIFNSDKPIYGGSGQFENRQVTIISPEPSYRPTHLRVSLAPHSTIVLEEVLF